MNTDVLLGYYTDKHESLMQEMANKFLPKSIFDYAKEDVSCHTDGFIVRYSNGSDVTIDITVTFCSIATCIFDASVNVGQSRSKEEGFEDLSKLKSVVKRLLKKI